MPITPYNTPVQYKYTPLGLEAFAAPLSQMQEKFDITKMAVEAEDFNLAHLPYGTDPEKAKKLLETVKSKRDELAKNLLDTKNYRQASQKLLQLRKLWKEDPESLAIQSNYRRFQELDKEQKDRVDKSDGITRDQYLEWKNRAIDQYSTKGGTAFKATNEDREGNYNQFGYTPRLKDQAKELEEIRFKIMNAQPEKVRDLFSQAGITMSDREVHSIETLIKEKKFDELKSETEAYLKRYPGFTEWATEVADYNLWKQKSNPEEYNKTAQSLLGNYSKEASSYITKQEEKAKKGNKEAREYLKSEDYKSLKELQGNLNEMISTGKYDENIVKNLFTEQHLNKVFNSKELANILSYKNITANHSFRNLPKEDDGSGSGSDKDEDLLGGMMTPLTYEQFDISGINKQKTTSGKNLYGTIKDINNIANGAMGLAIMGKEGSSERKQLLKDPAAMRERANQILTAYSGVVSKGGNYKDFHNKLKNLGISENLSATLYKNFSEKGSSSVNKLAAALENTEYDANNYVNAKENLVSLQKATYDNIDYKTIFNKIGDAKPEYYSDKGGKVYKDRETFNKLFDQNSYTSEQYKKAGITKPSKGNIFTTTEDTTLTFNQVAKLKGYKDVQDAIKKGYDFEGAVLSSTYASGKISTGDNITFSGSRTVKQLSADVQQQLMTKGLIKNDQSYRYIGDKKVDKFVTAFFLQESDLSNFEPAYVKTQQGQPGFDKEGKLLPGTQLDFNTNTQAKMVKHGNSTFWEVPIKYKNENGEIIQTTTVVKPKKGSAPAVERLLNHIDSATQTGDNLDAQTNQMIKTMKFDQRFSTNFSKPLVEGIYVEDKLGKQTTVTRVPSGDPGTNIEIIKVSTGDKGYTLKVAVTNDVDPPIFLSNPETGKDFYSNDPEVVKAFIAKQLQL